MRLKESTSELKNQWSRNRAALKQSDSEDVESKWYVLPQQRLGVDHQGWSWRKVKADLSNRRVSYSVRTPRENFHLYSLREPAFVHKMYRWLVSYVLVVWQQPRGTGQHVGKQPTLLLLPSPKHKERATSRGRAEREQTGQAFSSTPSSLAELKAELGDWRNEIPILNWTTLNFLTTESIREAVESTSDVKVRRRETEKNIVKGN